MSNVYDDTVIMSNETYEQTMRDITAAEFYRDLLVAVREINEGKGLDGVEVLKTMKKKYGID